MKVMVLYFSVIAFLQITKYFLEVKKYETNF